MWEDEKDYNSFEEEQDFEPSEDSLADFDEEPFEDDEEDNYEDEDEDEDDFYDDEDDRN